MGFQHGDGSEKLLVCSVCKAELELDANFCSDCGAQRTSMLAASPTATVQPNTPVGTPTNVIVETPEIENPIPKPPKPKRQPRLRPAIYNFANKFGTGIRNKAKIIYIVSSVLIVFGSYFIIQTLIFMSSAPKDLTERYVNAVSARDVSEVSSDSTIFPNPDKLPVLPKEFQAWVETEGLTWKTSAEWNGWFGKGSILLTPMEGDRLKEKLAFPVDIKAKYKMKYGIFRDIDWVVANPIASIKMDFGRGKDIGISINDVPAGSVENPAIKSQTYAVLPGVMNVVLQGSGFTKERKVELLTGSSGYQELNLPNVEYDLSGSRLFDATSQMEKALSACLKRDCNSLPYLSEYDFDFSNQPTTYLYKDYFVINWDNNPSCSVANSGATSPDDGYVSLSCSVGASASVKWMLYRIWLTTYYDLGYDYKTFNLTVSANIERTSSPYKVKVKNISIQD